MRRETPKPATKYIPEASVMEWLESNSFEVIDDGQTEVFRRGDVDVVYDDGWWKATRKNRHGVIEYEMTFSPMTPASIVVYSIQYSL